MDKMNFSKARTLQISAIIIFFSIIIYQFVSLEHRSNAVRFQQTEKFSYSLTNLAAAEATRYLTEKKIKELQLLIDSLVRDPMVRDATIYDELGQIIYQSKQAMPLLTLLKVDGPADAANGVIPYVAELYSDKKKIGYIRITLEQDHVLSLIYDYQQHGLAVLQLLLVLSLITGMILMAIFFKKSEVLYTEFKKRVPHLPKKIKNEIKKLIKTATK